MNHELCPNSTSTALYRHYKGHEYRVITVVKHSETLEEIVMYEGLYDDHPERVRPKEMFLEDVEVDGVKKLRFEYMGE